MTSSTFAGGMQELGRRPHRFGRTFEPLAPADRATVAEEFARPAGPARAPPDGTEGSPGGLRRQGFGCRGGPALRSPACISMTRRSPLRFPVFAAAPAV
jgi:hypothetical protein